MAQLKAWQWLMIIIVIVIIGRVIFLAVYGKELIAAAQKAEAERKQQQQDFWDSTRAFYKTL